MKSDFIYCIREELPPANMTINYLDYSEFSGINVLDEIFNKEKHW